MTAEFAIQILRQALLTALWLSAPLLLTAFVVGLAVSLLQIVTSIQDSAFATVPRLIAILAVSLVSLPWMLKQLTTYTIAILANLGRYAQ